MMDGICFNNPLSRGLIPPSDSQCELNERIKNSFITKLEPHHLPDEVMGREISSLLSLFGHSDSISFVITLKKKIINEFERMKEELFDMRERIFTIRNKNSRAVYGVLSEGFTINDRDDYIKKLMSYFHAEYKVTHITQKSYEGYFFISGSRGGHHSTSLWGDMEALKCLIEGKPAKLPDLTYNVGELQCG